MAQVQSMLFRFRSAQLAEMGLLRTLEERPRDPNEVKDLAEAEKWRQDVMIELSEKIGRIQERDLDEFKIRELNDYINKLLDVRLQWENRIIALGGRDYRKVVHNVVEQDGRVVPGSKGGYKYFGRAKELLGVKELFDAAGPEPIMKTKIQILRQADIDYYGYRDEEDGTLLDYEASLDKADENAEEDEILRYIEENEFITYNPTPAQAEVEAWLVEKRRSRLLDNLQ